MSLSLVENNESDSQNEAGVKKYQINEIFYSLQGEGVRAGTPNIFIRFSGCNLQCSVETHGFDCDTEFISGVKYTQEQILEQVSSFGGCEWIIFTGGEPLLQLDKDLCEFFKSQGYKLAIETNGTVDPGEAVIDMLDWITCSPKIAEHAVRLPVCNELKYVRDYGQGIPKPKLKNVEHQLISPAFSGNFLNPKTLDWCIKLVKENPSWKLSVQQHKFWNIR